MRGCQPELRNVLMRHIGGYARPPYWKRCHVQ